MLTLELNLLILRQILDWFVRADYGNPARPHGADEAHLEAGDGVDETLVWDHATWSKFY